MNANDANIVKFSFVQSQTQKNVSLDRQTGQLLSMPVNVLTRSIKRGFINTLCLNQKLTLFYCAA